MTNNMPYHTDGAPIGELRMSPEDDAQLFPEDVPADAPEAVPPASAENELPAFFKEESPLFSGGDAPRSPAADMPDFLRKIASLPDAWQDLAEVIPSYRRLDTQPAPAKTIDHCVQMSSRWMPGQGTPLLGGTLYVEDESDFMITAFRYVARGADTDTLRRLHERCKILCCQPDLPEFFSYFGVSDSTESGDYVLKLYTAASDAPISLRQAMETNCRPDAKEIRDKLLCLLGKLEHILPEGLGILSLDTVFIDRKGRLRILPVGVARPPEYPADSGLSADMFAAVMLGEEILQDKALSERPAELVAPDDEILLRCLLPASMRPELSELLRHLGLDDCQPPVERPRPAPQQSQPAEPKKAEKRGFWKTIFDRVRQLLQDEKDDNYQEGSGTIKDD